MSYWDTSALLKLYLEESDSVAFLGLAAATPKMVVAFIGKHEARTAFRRREAEGALATGGGDNCYQKLIQDAELGRIEFIAESAALEYEFGNIINQCLSQTPPIFVRTNDALHLAAARLAGETEFASADRHQRAAAAFLGFACSQRPFRFLFDDALSCASPLMRPPMRRASTRGAWSSSTRAPTTALLGVAASKVH